MDNGFGTRLQNIRISKGLTQEVLAEKLNVSRQSISKWEMNQAMPETEKVIQISKLFEVTTDRLLLEEEQVQKNCPQQLHLGSIYLVVRNFEEAVSFYEKLLNMTVSTTNCGNKFAEFYFDNKCLSLMNEANIEGHHYSDGDYKFVQNYWVEDLKKEYRRLQELSIGPMTEIKKANNRYYYFHLWDVDNNVIEITGEIKTNSEISA